jgi:SET domain-containing protein
MENAPATEIRTSKIPSAGLGLFALEEIKQGRLIGRMEGEVEPNPNEPDFDCFEIADGGQISKAFMMWFGMTDSCTGISLRCSREGIYYANEKRFAEANAEFRYMEGKRRREMVLRARRDIEAGEEICAQYSDGKKYVNLIIGTIR